MNTIEMVENYSYAVDIGTILFCAILAFIIQYVLYFATDKKFKFVRRAIVLVLLGTVSNIFFAFVCEKVGNIVPLIYVLREINHFCFSSCLYLFILYLYDLLGLKGRYVLAFSHITRLLFCLCMIFDFCSFFTGIGLFYDGQGWHDPIVSFYNVFYVYGVLLLICMLFIYNHRLSRTVRLSLIATEFIVGIIMFVSAIKNTNTFTSLTYILPIIVVLIIIHSNPIDVRTGTMSYKSFASYVERYIKKNISLDFLILQLMKSEDFEVPEEVGKVLSTFWHSYYQRATFFVLENGCYILVVPRIKENGDTLATMKTLFYEVFPKYYSKFNMNYKVIGLPDMDFIQNAADIKHIVNYQLRSVEENSMLIINDSEKNKMKIMRSVKETLADIENKHDLDDERVLVYCQPIKNNKTGVFDTAEALLRLSIPEEPMVMPSLVIPLAEGFEYIHILTLIMLNKVCKELKTMEEEGYSFKRVSINVAASELRIEGFCEEIIRIIEANEVSPEQIGIELTESQSDKDFKILKKKISLLKNYGMTIYLDDFGTGYSNFERILKLGFDVIKYDRSVLLSAELDENVAIMLQKLAEAFRNMEYKTLFEGIETERQIDICDKCGADYMQGFNFSKPIPIAEVREYFKKK